MKTRNSKMNETAVKSVRIFTTVFVTVLILSVSALAVNTKSAAGSLASLLNKEKEAKNKVEEWMLNANNFYFDFTLEEATDANLEMESWIVNESNFGFDFNLEPATEEALEMEKWMTDASFFGMASYLETETEDAMEVENWMLNDSLFSKKNKAKTKKESESEKEGEVLAEVNTETRKKAVAVTSQKTQFGRRTMILVEDEDPKLKMEQWMVDYRHWNTK